jgi:predicted ATP-binding protein involved in virulence
MRLKSLRLKNFRCFAEDRWEFDPQFNVLIGDNATGKTTILDALSIGIGSFFLGIDSVYAKTILYKDIRKNTFLENREYQLPCEIELEGNVGVNEENLIWERNVLSSKGNTRREKDTNKLAKMASEMQQLVRDGEKVDLPVFNYYGTGRLWQERKKTIKTLSPSSKFDAYIDSIEPISTSSRFVSWMKTRTLTELQTGIKDEALVLVKASVGCFLSTTERIEFDVKLDSIILEKLTNRGSNKIVWTEMSDGYRNIIAMAADLTYRCYTLNSHLGIHAIEQSKGVVLIDEIDLHLHPKWQRTVVDSFKKAFPNLQFIVTSHSPFVVQSLKNKELIDLEGKNFADDYNKRGVEDIVEGEMKVLNVHRSERFVKMKQKAAEYYDLISRSQNFKNDKDLELLMQELDQLLLPFYDEPAYVTYLESFKHLLNKK